MRTSTARPFGETRWKLFAGGTAGLVLVAVGLVALRHGSSEKPVPAVATNPPVLPVAAFPVSIAPPVVAPQVPVERPAPPARTVRHRVIPKAEPKVEPPPAAAPAPMAEPPKDDCDPPYYFVGDKKLFKPDCI